MDLPLLFFPRRRDADGGEGVAVARQPAVEAQAKGLRVAFAVHLRALPSGCLRQAVSLRSAIGFDSGVLFVQPLRGDDLAVHSPISQLPAQAEAKAARLINEVDAVPFTQQPVYPSLSFSVS